MPEGCPPAFFAAVGGLARGPGATAPSRPACRASKPAPAPSSAPAAPRDVFVYFISGAKEKAPAAAMALIEALALMHR